MRKLGLKIIDIYIIRKFLGTFVFALLIIIAIAVVFDISEKIDDFIELIRPYGIKELMRSGRISLLKE